MNEPNQGSEVEVDDGSVSQYDAREIQDQEPDHEPVEIQSQPTSDHDEDLVQVEIDADRDQLLTGPTPNTQQVLGNQNEEVVFDNTSQTGRQVIQLDTISPVMHPDRRSTMTHNQLVEQANRNNDLYLTTPVTPMRPPGPYMPNVSLDPPHTGVYYLNVGGPAGGDGGGSDPSSSTTTSRSGTPRPQGHRAQPSRKDTPMSSRRQVINGRMVKVHVNPVADSSFVKRRPWDKFKRHELDPEQRIAFEKAASGYVLSKSNKLRVVQLVTEDKDILTNLLNTHDQLRALRNHMYDYDLDDVFTVVTPIEEDRPETHSKTYDLLTEYPRVTPAMVALSIRHYNRWIDEPFIAENLNLTFTLIKNNMDDVLLGQCLEEYEKYRQISRGGPLLFIIAILKINSINSKYREFMWTKVKGLEIRKIQGENVTHIVSLLTAAYHTFRAVSTDDLGMNAAPSDWSEHILKIMQTSSVTRFNEVFADEEELVHRNSANTGGQAIWPQHDYIMTRALGQYERLLQSNEWNVPQAAMKKSYLTQTSGDGVTNRDHSNLWCYNCGKKGHIVPQCHQKRDEEAIKRNRDKANKDRKAKSNKGANAATVPTSTPSDAKTTSDKAKTKKIDGLLYKFTKEGTWACVDPVKIEERKAKGAKKLATKAARSDQTSTSTANVAIARPPVSTTNTTAPTPRSTATRDLQCYFRQLA